MSKYEEIVGWLESYWLGAILLVVLAVLAGIPSVRDGAVLLWGWLRMPFRQKAPEKRTEPLVIDVGEERVTFDELLRSIQHDVVKVHAHTHALGVVAEYRWLNHVYPEHQLVRQRVTTLNLLVGEKYEANQVYFDVVTVELGNGRQKDVYFDISDFFGGGISSHLDPQSVITSKLAALYGREVANGAR